MSKNHYLSVYNEALSKMSGWASSTTPRMLWLENRLKAENSNYKSAESLQDFLAKENDSEFKRSLIKKLDKTFPKEGWYLFNTAEDLISLRIYQRLLLKHKYEGYSGSVFEQYEKTPQNLILMCNTDNEGLPFSLFHSDLGELTAQEYENLTSPHVAEYFDVDKIINKARKELHFIIFSLDRENPGEKLTAQEARDILQSYVSDQLILPRDTENAIRNLVKARELTLEEGLSVLHHFMKAGHIKPSQEKIDRLYSDSDLSTKLPLKDMVAGVRRLSADELHQIEKKVNKLHQASEETEQPNESNELSDFLIKTTRAVAKEYRKIFSDRNALRLSSHEQTYISGSCYILENIKESSSLNVMLEQLIDYVGKASKNTSKKMDDFNSIFVKAFNSSEAPKMWLSSLSQQSDNFSFSKKSDKKSVMGLLGSVFSPSTTAPISENLLHLKKIENALTYHLHGESNSEKKVKNLDEPDDERNTTGTASITSFDA